MNDGLPTDDMTLDSLVRCPECLGKGWSSYDDSLFTVVTGQCHFCDGDGVVPLHWAMENVA